MKGEGRDWPGRCGELLESSLPITTIAISMSVSGFFTTIPTDTFTASGSNTQNRMPFDHDPSTLGYNGFKIVKGGCCGCDQFFQGVNTFNGNCSLSGASSCASPPPGNGIVSALGAGLFISRYNLPFIPPCMYDIGSNGFLIGSTVCPVPSTLGYPPSPPFGTSALLGTHTITISGLMSGGWTLAATLTMTIS